jgi:hypothetical protein
VVFTAMWDVTNVEWSAVTKALRNIALALNISTCIQEVFGSILGRDLLLRGISLSSSVPDEKFCDTD